MTPKPKVGSCSVCRTKLSCGPPLAIAPLPQVKQVLDYATSVITPSKILMGMSLYGYDWKLPFVKGKSRASGLSNNAAQNLAISEESPIRFDTQAKSPTFKYTADGEQHEVWFDDAMSANAKLDFVTQYGLRGISLWVLGNSFPQLYPLLRERFRIRPGLTK